MKLQITTEQGCVCGAGGGPWSGANEENPGSFILTIPSPGGQSNDRRPTDWSPQFKRTFASHESSS